MNEPNNHTLTDNQNEQALNSLRNEIESLKLRLTKKEDRIATLDVRLNIVMERTRGQACNIAVYQLGWVDGS